MILIVQFTYAYIIFGRPTMYITNANTFIGAINKTDVYNLYFTARISKDRFSIFQLLAFADDNMDIRSPVCDSLGRKFNFDEDDNDDDDFFIDNQMPGIQSTEPMSELYRGLPNSKLNEPVYRPPRKGSEPSVPPRQRKCSVQLQYVRGRSSSEPQILSSEYVLFEKPTAEVCASLYRGLLSI